MPKKSGSKGGASESRSCCGEGCCGSGSACCGLPDTGCCQVEAVVSVDGRGQMVLPKDVRDKFGFTPGSKLAVVAWSKGDEPCCLTLHKADEIADRLRTTYGPVLREVLG